MPVASNKTHVRLTKGRAPRSAVLLVALFSLALAPTASAQRSGNGSVYSRFGLGELRSFGSSQAQAMGGDGFGLASPTLANFSNPAAWGDLLLTRVGAGFRFESISASDAANNSSDVGYGTLDHVMFSFPLKSRRLGVGMKFSPFTRVGYNVSVDNTLGGADGVQDSTAYRVNFDGGGGLQEINLGLGYQIGGGVSVGATINFLFGIIDEVQETRFDDGSFGGARFSTSTRLSGVAGTVGLLGLRRSLLRENDELRVGLVFTVPSKLNGRRVLTIGESLDKDTLGTPIDVNVDLPWRMGAGLAYSPSPKVTIMMDGRYEPWTQLKTDVPFPGVVPNTEQLQNRLRIATGVEFLPAGNDLFASYFKQIAYRLGAFVDKSYVQPLPGQTLRSIGLSGGLSLPTRIPGTRIDINLEVGRRGRIDDGLIQETIYRIGINVNVGERWFQKRKLG